MSLTDSRNISDESSHHIYKKISSQLTSIPSVGYFLLNFSNLPDPVPMLQQCNLLILATVSYTYISGSESLDFYRCLPNSFCRSSDNLIYFVNSYTQIKDNHLWFECRKNKDDLIIDLSGNVIHTNVFIDNKAQDCVAAKETGFLF